MEQLGLFEEENTLFNRGVQKLVDMDFSGCLETLRHYERLYPWGRDVVRETAMAEFWLEKLRKVDWDNAQVEECVDLWRGFEEQFGCVGPEHGIEQELQQKLFSRLADRLDSDGEGKAELDDGTPAGVVYLLAGKAERAIARLQALIPENPEHGAIYGYLGDAYTLRGDSRTARICYREAFVIAPDQVDIRHVRDLELRERLKEFESREQGQSDFPGWFPVVAQLDGFFERRIIRDLEELKDWIGHYLVLLKTYRKTGDWAHVPRLFYHAMVLSDNASVMQFIKKVDLIEVRRRMRDWAPDLFARHMRELEK